MAEAVITSFQNTDRTRLMSDVVQLRLLRPIVNDRTGVAGSSSLLASVVPVTQAVAHLRLLLKFA